MMEADAEGGRWEVDVDVAAKEVQDRRASQLIKLRLRTSQGRCSDDSSQCLFASRRKSA